MQHEERVPVRPLVAVGVLVAALLVGGVVGAMERSTPTMAVVEGGVATTIVGTAEVHVAGWVTEPGVVLVSEGALVAEAIHAAGGLLPGARTDLINLAEVVTSGQQVLVPGPGAAPNSPDLDDGLISLNSGTALALEALPGVGPVLAQRIVEFRDLNGPFSAPEDLLDVPGIGEAKLASLRELISLR